MNDYDVWMDTGDGTPAERILTGVSFYDYCNLQREMHLKYDGKSDLFMSDGTGRHVLFDEDHKSVYRVWAVFSDCDYDDDPKRAARAHGKLGAGNLVVKYKGIQDNRASYKAWWDNE